MSLFFSYGPDTAQARWAKKSHSQALLPRMSGKYSTGVATLLLPHSPTAATSIPLFPSLPLPPSLPPYPVTPQPPIPHLHFHPLASTHPPLFIYFIYYLIYFSQNLPPRFEPTSHVGERATLKPPLATGESLFCHAFILASCECRPSHASGEPTGVQMTVLCSQTAMNNETEVMYEVADAGRGGKKKKRWAPTLANGLSSSIVRLDPCMGETVTKED